MEQLITVFQAIVPLTDALELRLRKTVRRDEFRRGHRLVREGQVCDRLYFIERGILRLYVKHNNKELNNWFMLAGDIATSVTSFFDQSRSLEIMEVLKNCVLWSISRKELEDIYKEFPEFRTVALRIMEKYYSQDNRQKIYLMFKDAGMHYKYLLMAHPRLVREIPHKHLASYMGITPQSLLTIRKNQK
ncbi:MAG TPA: Crp/Fnr family transcriptional regulator [Puia sp.]